MTRAKQEPAPMARSLEKLVVLDLLAANELLQSGEFREAAKLLLIVEKRLSNAGQDTGYLLRLLDLLILDRSAAVEFMSKHVAPGLMKLAPEVYHEELVPADMGVVN